MDHDGCVKRLASRRPPPGKRRKGKAESAQSCASPRTGLHVSVKGTDICRCDAHVRINAHQSLFCQWFDSISWFMTAFPPFSRSVEKCGSPHFSLRQVRRYASRMSFTLKSRSISDGWFTSANGMVRPCSSPASGPNWRGAPRAKEHAMSATSSRRPALTALAHGAPVHLQAGTWRNRGVTTAGTGWPPCNTKGARPCPRASSMSASMYH